MPSRTLATDLLAVAVSTAPAAGTVETWTVTNTPSDTPGPTATGLGATPPYDIIVGIPGGTTPTGAEICHVTAVNVGARTITLTRGYAGTTPVTHLVNSILTHIITGEYLNASDPRLVAPLAHAHVEADVTSLTSDLSTLTSNVAANTSAIALRAPIASPALTGTPTAPTAAGGTNTTQIATTAFVQAAAASPGLHHTTHESGGSDAVTLAESQITNLTSDLAAKAALASPTFTGTPAAPTATPGTSTTQLATTAFVAAQGAAAIPESQVTNLTADLALKAPLASPALTGTPTAPTAAAATNTTQIATTAFVVANAGGAGRTTFSNANYTILATDKYVAQVGTLSAPRTATLPAASAVAAGYMLFLADESNTVSGTNTITVARAGADTINGATSFVLAQPFKIVRLISDGTSKWTADLIFQPTVVDFTAGGTSVIPAGCQTVTLIAVGGGGGGGSGRRGAAATVRGGGGGGAAGGWSMNTYNAADLGGVGATLTVSVGAGGVGNAGKTVDSTDGSAGGSGGTSEVKAGGFTFLHAGDSATAGGGGTTSGGSGGSSNNTVAQNIGPAGGAGGTGAAGANGTFSFVTAGSGAGGGGISSGDVHFAGGTGGRGALGEVNSENAGGTAGTLGGGNGGTATTLRAGTRGGGGAGGGGGNTGGAGGNGGNGIRGGGGGGGGASVNGNNSGSGGNGGDGWVRVIYQ